MPEQSAPIARHLFWAPHQLPMTTLIFFRSVVLTADEMKILDDSLSLSEEVVDSRGTADAGLIVSGLPIEENPEDYVLAEQQWLEFRGHGSTYSTSGDPFLEKTARLRVLALKFAEQVFNMRSLPSHLVLATNDSTNRDAQDVAPGSDPTESILLSDLVPIDVEPARPGRKKADPETIRTEESLVEQWNQARGHGTHKIDFVRDIKMPLGDFNRLLGRNAKRKKRADN